MTRGGQSPPGERTRLACWRARPRDRELFRVKPIEAKLWKISARAPKSAREARALPRP